MTARQQIVRLIYPFLRLMDKLFGTRRKVYTNDTLTPPQTSFFALSFIDIVGSPTPMELFKGRKVLLVNTASDCGYTPQLKTLQKLQDCFAEKLVVIGFPSNDFREQEKENNETIAAFCAAHFGVRFLLAQKSVVLKKEKQHPVFQWLTNRNLNGWNNHEPGWNFTKYLVNEQGILTHVFDTGISPLDQEILIAVK